MSNSGWGHADETGKAARNTADLNAEILGATTTVGPNSGVIEIDAGNFGLGHGDRPAVILPGSTRDSGIWVALTPTAGRGDSAVADSGDPRRGQLPSGRPLLAAHKLRTIMCGTEGPVSAHHRRRIRALLTWPQFF